MTSQDVLIKTLVELADTLVDDFDVVDLLSLLTDRCVEAFDVSDAGLMLAAPIGGDLRVMASSSATMRDLEIYELQASEGPCLDCYHSGQAVSDGDIDGAHEKWPRFTPAAIAAGFRAVDALPMQLRGTTIGALNLFRTAPGAMTAPDVSAAQAFADVATIAILQHQAVLDNRIVNDQLNHALNSRVTIEQAKGMFAERAGLGVDEAFQRLRHHARSHNLRLIDLAKDFIDGTVPLSSIDLPHPPVDA